MADGKPKGDIRDLYAYYRFSDHTLTNIVLKGKALFNSDVWFEGFMDWGFTNCTFNKSFYFGVEGERLEEDTRGTGENAEPFPPYGSNGLNFDNCTFTESFEIKDNCVVVFKECTFTKEFTIEDSVRVEFIECTFTKGITFKTFCEAKFIRCNLTQEDFCIDAADHCTFYFNNCVHGNPADKAAFGFDNDCKATFHSKDKAGLSAVKEVFKINNGSVVKVYNYGAITSIDLPMANVTDNSKFEVYETTSISSATSDILKAVDSEIYMKEVESCGCPVGRAIYAENSLVRSVNVDLIKSGIGVAIEAINSEISVVNTPIIQSDNNIAIHALDSEMSFSDITTTIFSGLNKAIHAEGTTELIVRRCPLIESGQRTAIYIDSGAWVNCSDVDVVLSGAATAIKVFNGGRWTDDTGTRRAGIERALEGADSKIEVTDVTRYEATNFAAIELVNCGYDMRNIDLITSLRGGFHTTNCQGVVSNIVDILAGEGEAVKIVGASGPMEWDTISLIESALETAWSVSGDLYGMRGAKIGTIKSGLGNAINWNQTSGDVFLYDVDTIESSEEVAVVCTVAGRLRFEKVNSITSEEKEAMIVTVDGGEAFFNDIVKIESLLMKALTITVNSGEAHFNEVQHTTSEEEVALTVTVAEGATLRFNDFTDITSQLSHAVEGTVSGELIVTNGETIESELGQAVKLSGASATYSFVRFADIALIQAQTPSDDMFEILDCNQVQLHRVEKFRVETSSRYIVYLKGTESTVGRCEVIDCPDITASEVTGGLFIYNFFDFDVVCSRTKGKITIDKATGPVLAILYGSGRVANFSELKDADGTNGGIGFYLYNGNKPGKVLLQNIDVIEGDIGVEAFLLGTLEIFNVGEIKSPNGDGPAFSGRSGSICVQGGDQATVISAKDVSSSAIDIYDTDSISLIGVDTERSKGKSVFTASRVIFNRTKFNGDFEVTSCSGEAHNSEFNTSVSLTESRIEFYNSPVALASQAGTAQDFDLDENSSAYLFKSPISGSGEVKGAGVLHGDIETITAKMTTSGVVILNKSDTVEIDSTGVTVFNDVSVVGDVTLTDTSSLANTIDVTGRVRATTSSLLWNKSYVSNDITFDDGAMIMNHLGVHGGLNFTGNEGGIFNKFDGGAGSIALSEDSGTIFNQIDVVWSITIPSDSAAIFNQVQEMNSLFTLDPDASCIINRLIMPGGYGKSFLLHGTSSLIASKIECYDFEMRDASSGISGVIVNNLFVENDLTIGNNTGLLGAAIQVENDTEVQLTGSFASIGGQFSKTPTGDGVMLDMGPTAGAYAPREGVYPGSTATWPIKVTGLHIHADTTASKNAITMMANDLAYAVCGDAYSGYRDVVCSGYDAAVLEGGVEGTFVRQAPQHYNSGFMWPSQWYSNAIEMWFTNNEVTGMTIFSGTHKATNPLAAQGWIDMTGGLLTVGAREGLNGNIHMLLNSLYTPVVNDTDNISFGQPAVITAPDDLTLYSSKDTANPINDKTKLVLDAINVQATLKAYNYYNETDIFLDGMAGEQIRSADVKIDDVAPAVLHNGA